MTKAAGPGAVKGQTGKPLRRMMKHAGLVIGLLFAGVPPAATDVVVTTDSGQRVLLRESGTWEYLTGRNDDIVVTAGDGQRVLLRDSGRWEYLPDRSDEPPPAAAPAEVQNRFLLLSLGTGVLFLLLVSLGLGWYFLILQPGRKRRRLFEALEIIDRGLEDQYPRAEQLVDQAITSGLGNRDIREAYFARAFLLAKKGRLENTVADLELADRADPAVLYLHLWSLVGLKKMKEAFNLYDKNKTLLGGYLKADILVSRACFSLGADHWKKQEIEAAVSYFDRVRELKVLASRVPASASDLQVTHGVLALFNNHGEEAETNFKAAQERAEREKTSIVSARLGLLICNWRRQENPDLDREITDILALIERDKPFPPARTAGDRKRREAETEKKKADNTEKAPPPTLSEDDILRRNVCLLHAVSLLYTWLRLPEKKNLPRAEIQKLETRAARVSALDPDMLDPDLLLGLIEYYFMEDRRDQALERLRKSGSDIPEIMLVLKREARLKELERDRLTTFFCMVRDYVGDQEVAPEIKQALLNSLEEYERFRKISGDLAISDSWEGGGPTIQGMQARGALLRKRVRSIVKPMQARIGQEKVSLIDGMVRELETTTQVIRKNAETLEKTELELMINTGEFLLKEEEPVEIDLAKNAAEDPSPPPDGETAGEKKTERAGDSDNHGGSNGTRATG